MSQSTITVTDDSFDSDVIKSTKPVLDDYWASLTYELDASMEEGLRTFYRLAAEIGEIERAPALRWVGR